MRRWQYRPGAAYVPKFTQTLPESGTGRVEMIESLRWFEQRAKKRDMIAYLVQIVNKPCQIIALNGWSPLFILLTMKYVTDSIMKLGRGPVEATELF